MKNKSKSEKNESAIERIKNLNFFKEKSVLPLLQKSKLREYFERLFLRLTDTQKQEVLDAMSKFVTTAGEWKILHDKLKIYRLKNFSSKMFHVARTDKITSETDEVNRQTKACLPVENFTKSKENFWARFPESMRSFFSKQG